MEWLWFLFYFAGAALLAKFFMVSSSSGDLEGSDIFIVLMWPACLYLLAILLAGVAMGALIITVSGWVFGWSIKWSK